MVKDKGTYMLEELDRSRFSNTVAGDRLKRFHSWQWLHLDHAPDLDLEKLPNLDDFLLNNSNSDLFDVPNDISNR